MALLPVLVLAALAGVQVAVGAHAWGTAHEAARAGARAALVGAPASRAARAVLGDDLVRGSIVAETPATGGAHRVRVAVRVPMVLPWVPALSVSAEAVLAPMQYAGAAVIILGIIVLTTGKGHTTKPAEIPQRP